MFLLNDDLPPDDAIPVLPPLTFLAAAEEEEELADEEEEACDPKRCCILSLLLPLEPSRAFKFARLLASCCPLPKDWLLDSCPEELVELLLRMAFF